MDAAEYLRSGRGDLALRLIEETGGQRYPIFAVGSPLWECYRLWGFESLMRNVAAAPDLVHHACRRNLEIACREVGNAAALGARGIWIEECLTDMISPDSYRLLCLPYLRGLIEEIRGRGLASFFYFCGNPAGKLEAILSAGPDAVGFEESKKDFLIDLEDLGRRVDGRSALLGNLDAIGIVERSTDEQLREAILRQISVGRRNRSRFVMSTGSPITPATSVQRVQRYLELARELGAGSD
jgi:uroporphyrinogen-III decarboxylase